MKEDVFIRADEIASDLDVSKGYAYKLIRELNHELREKGFITVNGRVSRKFYEERIYAHGKQG